MITISDFESIITKSESSSLDFKREQYNIINDIDNRNTAKFIKDIISFCNTIRTDSALIIIGIGINSKGEKDLIGINDTMDDAIFQEKIMNKVSSNPVFSYYNLIYQDKTFGIIEIPIRKYPEPLFPTLKMKGLDTGKIYFRRGSSNSEANGREVIMINKWLETIEDPIKNKTLTIEIPKLLAKITSRRLLLSECIAETLQLAEEFNLSSLKALCKNELSGWHIKASSEEDLKSISYRVTEVVISPYEIEVNPFMNVSSGEVLNEMKKTDGFFSQKVLFNQPIAELETFIRRINEKKDKSLLTLSISANRVYSKSNLGDSKVKMYSNRDNLENIYNGIRQNLIDKILECN